MPDPNLNSQQARSFFTKWTAIWIVVWVGLFALTHWPKLPGPRLPQNSDKVIHFCAYFVLALIGGRSALSRDVKLTFRWLITWFIVYAAYGAADELLQKPVHRHPSVWDWVADVAGAAAALGITYVNRPYDMDDDASPEPASPIEEEGSSP